MRKAMPQVRQYMTPAPQTISRTATVGEARGRMKSSGIRHLPVVDGTKIVGVLTERSVESVYHRTDLDALQVGDIMIPDPYCVLPHTPLVEVAAAMAEEKFGCVVVQDSEGGRVAGIFTTVDACRALREHLERVFPE